MDFKIGQRLFYVPNHSYRGTPEGRYYEITKVGRRWIFLDDCKWNPTKIDKNTMCADGGNYSSPGKAYLSKEDYDRKVKRDNLWSAIRSKMDYSCPDHISLEDLERIPKILFNME